MTTKAVPFKDSVTLNGATIIWSTTRTMVTRDYDTDLDGEDNIKIQAFRPVSLDEMNQVVHWAKQLAWARAHGDHTCPISDSWIRVTGIDDTGHILIQVYRGTEPKGHGPAWEFATMNPANYSDAGPEAMASVAWIVAVCLALSRSTSATEMNNAIAQAHQSAVAALSKESVSQL